MSGHEAYLQRRWGGYIMVPRERKHARTIAAGTWEAVWAALRLVREGEVKTARAWLDFRVSDWRAYDAPPELS